MTTLDVGIAALRSSLSALRTAGGRFYDLYDRTGTTLKSVMPKGLYARALLIIITPMVVLQSVVAFVFMERHCNLVTQRLSAGVVQDIATLDRSLQGLSAGRRPHAAAPHRAGQAWSGRSTSCR